MKKLTFLTNMRRKVSAKGRLSDVSVDRRFTVGRLSGFGSKSLLKLVSVLALVLTIGVGQIWGDSYTWTLAAGDLGTTASPSTSVTKGSPSKTWSVAYTWSKNKYMGNLDGTKGLQIGAAPSSGNNRHVTSLVLSTSGISGTISNVTIYTSGANSVSATIGVSVGGTTFKNNGNNTASITNSNASYAFTGSASGTIAITWTQTSTKALYIKSISVTYTTGSTYSIAYADAGGVGTNGTYSASSTSSITAGTTITLSSDPASCYQLSSWNVYKTGTPATTVTVTNNQFTMPAYNVTVGATFGALPAGKTVNFDEGPGSCGTSSLTETCDGSGVTLPAVTATGVCKGWTTFAGWATAAVNDSSTTSVTVYAADSKFVPASNGQTLYAVYSKNKSGGSSSVTIAPEDLDVTSGNAINGATVGTITFGGAKGGNGTASNVPKYYSGTPNTIRCYASNDFTISSSNTISQIDFTYDGSYSGGTITPNTGSWAATPTTNWDQTWTGSATSITFRIGSSAWRITSIKITTGGGSTTYYCSDPNCCTPLGTINGSVSLSQLASPDPTKLKATWTMNASTGIASYTLEVYNSSDVLVKTVNNYTSGSEITGLNPCTTYYVKLYTVSSGSSYCDGGLISTSGTCTTNGYTLDVTKTNVTLSGGSEPTNICSNVSATYTATSGNVLPSTITVTNAGAENTGWTWNSSTGVLTINKASVTGNVTVTITGVAASCSGQYTFAYGATPQNDDPYITNPTKECFSQVSTTTEYQITNFTIPNTNTYYWVGYNGYFYNNGLGSNNASSSRNQFKYMPVANLQGSSCGGTGDSYKHAAAGAYGTLRIFSNYSDNNLYVGFAPAGYQMRVGSGESWSNIQLTRISSTSVWKSDIMTLDAALVAKNYYINVWTSGSYSSGDAGVAINNWTNGGSTISSMQRKTNSGNEDWASGVTAGMRGFFRTWTDNCANNGYAHFVPVHRLIYDANWPVSGEPAATYSSDVSVEESSNITVPAAPSAPTGYHFVAWNTAEGGGGTSYAPGDTYTMSAGASADVTLYAQWSNQTAITLNRNGNGSADGSATATYGSDLGATFTGITYTGTRYQLLGYCVNGTTDPIIIDAEGNLQPNVTGYTDASSHWINTSAAVTLKAKWSGAGRTITWSANGGTYATTFVLDGGTIALPAGTPPSCDAGDTDTYTTFIGWYTTAAGTSGSPTASIGSCGTKIAGGESCPGADATYYAVWGDGSLESSWSETTLGSISSSDEVVIAMKNSSGDYFALPNNGGDAKPVIKSISVSDGVITTTITNNDKWNISNSSGTLTIYPNGTTSTWLYCNDANDGVRIGTGTDKAFTIETYETGHDFLYNTSYSRYLGVYNSADWRCYKLTGTPPALTNNISGQTVKFFKGTTGATGFISSCCSSEAVVSVNPTSNSLALDIDGNASTSVSVSQSGGGAGRYHAPTIDPAVGATTDWEGSYKTSAYSVNFNATAAGTYTVKADFTETAAGCPKYGSATITVAANPILTPSSDNIAISATCGAASSATDITVNSRYLAGSSITASIVTSTGSGTLKISSDNSSFDTSNKTITGGTSSKATSHIYVRYDAIADETGSATGTLTLTQGSTTVNIPITVTVTCGCNIRFTSAADLVRVTAANGIWVQANSELALSGSYLKTNPDNANVSIRAYTDNAHFQLKASGATGEGTAKTSSANALSLATNVSSNTANGWTGALGVVYKPGAHNTTETATLTVEVYRNGGSTVYNSTTYTLYGRSLPENFVIAVTDGSGHWFAVPADMIAPWGGSCSSGLGTYSPYPIDVDNTTTPTALTSNAPARAVYTAAARSEVTTNPQTLRFKSVAMSGTGNYYLYGSSTSVDSDGSNTSIQNASFASSEKEKWFLDVVNWTNKEYNVHLASTLNTNVLAFTTAGGARNVGQYAANASTTKKSIYILPATSTCDNHIAPENITCYGIDADNYTIRFKPDRTKNYEVSLNGSSGWTSVTTRVINNCTDDSQPTLVEADIPMATYKGQTVYIRVKDDASDCKPSATFAVPNPSLSVNIGTWATMTGVAGQAFSNSDNSITISGLASCANTVSVESSNDDIVAEVNSSTGVVTLTMTAGNATAGVHNTTLTFTADGATTRTQSVTITMLTLAEQSFAKNGLYFSGNILCYSADLESTNYPLALANPLYKDGEYITLGDFNTNSELTFTDLTTGSTSIGSSLSVALNAAHSVKISLQNKIAAMVAGHTYRLAWTNTNKVVTNSAGLPYQDCYIDFVYSLDCDAPVAMVACPVGVNSFTANWDGPCDATNSSLNVYTKGAPTTILNNFENTTSNTFNLQYVGASNLSGNSWVTNVHGTSAGVVTVDADNGLLISDVSNNKYYNLFSPLLSQLIGTVNTTDEYQITIRLATDVAQSGIGVDFYVMSNGSSLARNTTPSITDKTVTIDGASGTSKRLAMDGSHTTVTHTFTVSGLAGTDRIRFLGWETAGVATASKNVYIFTISMRKLGSNVSVTGYPKNVTCSNKAYEVTGLSAGTTYYYTLTNSGHTSNEMTLTTRTAHTPQMGFNPGYAVLQSDGGGAVSEEVAITNGNIGDCARYFYSLCSASDISYTITGTNASMFSVDWSGVNYTIDNGYLCGNLVITYNPGGVEGVHTATLTVTESGQTFELPLKGITCPASFSTMATAATSVGNTAATANWSQSTTGNLMLSMDGALNAEMLLNGGFETGDKTGWTDSGVAGVLGGTITSTSATKHSGNYGVYTPVSNSTAMNISGSNYGAIFASPVTLTPGTYRMTAWVRGASDASTAGYLTASSVAIGLATINESTHNATKQYASADLGASNNTWQELTADFEVTIAGTYYPFVGHGNSKGAMFIDDVSLKRTAAEPNEEGYDAYPITSATSLNLTGLQPSTAYSYYVVNANGCESNVITFNTTGTLGDPELDADDVEISGSAGTTATAVAVVTATNVVTDITLSLGACTSGLSLGSTKLSSTGGAVTITYAIPGGATPGSSGTCTVTMTTAGLASPETFDIHWSVASGVDINTPIVEVTDITNESITIESNQTDADGAHIIISREMTPEEIAANSNVGDEIFFSKYYEAYSHKKLWAIFNPTDHKISLANTYVWRSSSSSSAWLIDKAFSLAGAGAIEAGYIHPNEEIIVYTKDQVGSCEAGKADMSDWYAGSSSDQSLSFSGDDALLLVRKDVSGTSDDPPSESIDGETSYSWRKYTDANSDNWWMLDMIGARTAANLPTDGACTTWSWTNCKTSTTETGDARGWVGTDGKYLDNTTYSTCSPYVLSTNRCLLIRERSVKCGNNAVATNVGDMYTLGKGGVPTEWNGAHVPTGGDQAAVSCNNFTFVGGYDYAGYYNSWVEMEDVDIAEATPNDDGSFTFEDMEIPKYYCHPYHIEVTQTVTLNGVEVENILAYTDYKVPIVVDEGANTTTAKFFSTPHADNTLTSAICNECDVVIRNNAQLSHISGGQARFRNMTVYPGAKFSNEANQAFQLNRLYMQSLNNTVGYAIINNDGSSIIADTIIHIKRINDADWYSFTLPYNCDVTTIRQLNGKVVGKYWDGSSSYVDEDWTIQYYDGAARQAAGTSAAAGQDSEFWRYVPANGTLQAGKAYIVGLFTTEWEGQHKTLYFPPTSYPGYSESGSDAKTTTVNNWATNLSSEKRHHGWNFTGSPYISRFGESTEGQGLNNTVSLIMGKLNESGSYEDETDVYVSIPIPGAKAYDQVRAAATTLDPFKGYFVQAIDPDNGEDGTLTLTYAKEERTLSAAPARRAASAKKQRVVVDLVVEGNNSSDIGGIVVDDKYTTEYEIGGDLMKMYAAANKPQLYFPDKDNQKLAYIAIPDANAENVPLEIYAPKAGKYVIRLNERSSRTAGAESVELLKDGNVVANLLIESYEIEATKGTLTGYSVRIRRSAQVTTSTETINGEHVTVICNNGQMSITNIPSDAEVLVFDMIGKLIREGKANGENVVNIDAPQQGVYNIVIQSTAGNAAIKTFVR